MGDAWLCAVTTTAVAAVMAAALRRPGLRNGALLVVGPLLSWAAAVGGVSSGLGLAVLLLVPYAYLLVAAALPWARRWARWAVPTTVMAGCLALATAAPRGLTTLLVLAIPFTSAAVALARVGFDRRAELAPTDGSDERVVPSEDVARVGDVGRVAAEKVRAERAAGHEPSRLERVLAPVVVTATALQGIAGLALVGYAAYGYLLETRHPSTGPWAGAAYVILGGLAVVGLALAGGFFALAVALRRRYPDFRRIFVVVQLVAVALLMGNSGHPWTGPGIAWGLGTAALALLGRGRRVTAPSGTTVR